MNRLSTLVAALGLLAASFSTAATISADGKPVTVFFVRHAETAASTRTGGDPDLSAQGRERADGLARLFSKAGVTHLYASQAMRTQQTLAPLAKALGLEVEVIPAQQGERQVQAVKSLPAGSVAVVAGHSNTVPQMVEALGGEIADLVESDRWGHMFEDDSYDRALLVTLPVGEAAVQTIELRYGRPRDAAEPVK
jgi:phosphohistidine phosphatase SixA